MPSKATMASALTSQSDGSSTRMSKLSKGSSFSAATSSDPPSASAMAAAPAFKSAPIKGSLKKPRHGVFEPNAELRLKSTYKYQFNIKA